MNVADAKGLRFECLPGCGFCCTTSPIVLPSESPGLRALVVNGRIPQAGHACSALGSDRRCTVYDARPGSCRLYPYHVHAGRRVQVTVTMACPGVTEGSGAEAQAAAAHEMATTRPGAAEMIASAKSTFAEFDRRMTEWGTAATSDKLRSSFVPHLDAFARPENLPALFAGLASGELVLGKNGARDVGALLDAQPESDLHDLLAEAATDAFDGSVLWVEPRGILAEGADERARSSSAEREFAWAAPKPEDVDVGALATAWTPEASAVLVSYLTRLTGRDHTEGAALWVVDASGYQATPAAAYGRVLAEAALHVALRAGFLAAREQAEVVDDALATRGVRAYETSYYSLPTLGSIL